MPRANKQKFCRLDRDMTEASVGDTVGSEQLICFLYLDLLFRFEKDGVDNAIAVLKLAGTFKLELSTSCDLSLSIHLILFIACNVPIAPFGVRPDKRWR